MPTQIQYYNSSAAITGILQPQTSECAIRSMRPIDPYPINTVSRIRPATGFQFRNISPPSGKPVWNDPRKKGEPWTGSLRKFRVILNHRPMESLVSRKAPFAARTLDTGSRYKDGRMGDFPQYNPLNDPHLFDYYGKKFGLQLQPRTPSRPRSALLPRSGNTRADCTRTRSVADGDILYKVTVKTGEKKEAGTDAKVFLQMKGSKGKMNKKRLYKKSGSKKSDMPTEFQFRKGSSHTFKVYGPEIGELQNIILEHDGLEKRQAWYVEEVSVTNTAWNKAWNIPCRRWLSLFHTDCQLSRTFSPVTGRRNDYTG
ncbi:uncharacterized protein [Heptranchias perlo]|uniref:uncharacterized protein n=1 Tax=Heptranchias perlo TaxID=212740 RepID=UPI00355AC02F